MLYLIPGLGADERVYLNFNVDRPTKIITWIDPVPNEPIRDYCRRLLDQIDINQEVELLGMSFGGIIAQEIAQLISVKKMYLVSTVKSPKEYPLYLKLLRFIPAHKPIPAKLLIWSNLITASYYFGTTTKEDTVLLKTIIKDTNHVFLKWAIHAITIWQPNTFKNPIVQIHGQLDKIFPIKSIKNVDFTVINGTHWMIVDKKDQIITIVNKY